MNMTATKLFLIGMMMTALLTPTSFGAIRGLAVQPLAPGIFALTWDIKGESSDLEVQRRIGQGEFESAGTVAADRKQFIDRCPAGLKAQERVAYRLVDKDRPTTEAWTLNSAQLLPDGGFELPAGPNPNLNGLTISVTDPWSAAIVDGGFSGQGRCLAFSTTDPNATAAFNLSSRWFIITPRSAYRFSWWVTRAAYGTSTLESGAYGMTKEKTKSFYEKTANLYVYAGTTRGDWVGTSSEPHLPRDLRYIYIVLRGWGSKHPQPIRVDDVSIIDRDLELLLETDVPQLVSQSRLAAQRHPDLGLQEQVEQLADRIQERQKTMAAAESQDIDAFLDQRADLCESVRELNRLAVIFRLAETEQ